ncbi:LysE/ArgO family amino acid transporter [Deefgea tanakiae]|uniref:LysE/ArgO family amino acid transporter n=1 Tax=Deefgea tanakiae TaxID=2865840 RepID=UPI0021046E80|nr:LysE/ArgO family amino acid transporter [Deefgea tanakiae]
MMIDWMVFIKALGLCAALIMAIGAQNAYVLRVGIQRQHLMMTLAVCIILDALLIALGVLGMGALVQASPILLGAARWGGAAFLIWYGLRSWTAILRRDTALEVEPSAAPISAKRALITILAISLLNPHVYLDTVVLLGSIGGSYPASLQPSFILGAASASLLWFCVLGFAAHALSRHLSRPAAWQWIDGITGGTMLFLAGTLVLA